MVSSTAQVEAVVMYTKCRRYDFAVTLAYASSCAFIAALAPRDPATCKAYLIRKIPFRTTGWDYTVVVNGFTC